MSDGLQNLEQGFPCYWRAPEKREVGIRNPYGEMSPRGRASFGKPSDM
jgi:hypothetical protein